MSVIFSAVDVDDVVVDSPVFPSSTPIVTNQFVGISDDNTIRVASISGPVKAMPLQFRQLSRTQRDALIGFFEAIDYSGEFTYTDHLGTEHLVRMLESTLAFPEISANNVQFDCTLTKV